MAQYRIRKGLDLPLAGAPAPRVEAARAVGQVALLGADTLGLRPSFLVQPGDRVRRGQALYEDRRMPGLRFTAPAAGTVRAIHRGERRAFTSLVIDVAADDADAASQVGFDGVPGDPRQLPAQALRDLLLASGLWTALRTRPFGHVAAPGTMPQALFVTAIDSRPHAPDPQLVLEGREAHFDIGLLALERLLSPELPVYLCVAAGSRIAVPGGSRATRHEFAGPHPAGTPGLHMHLVHPVGPGRSAWHIGYQDVAAIGHLLATGRLDVERVISLAGPAVHRPRLLRTRLGASIAELTAGELQPGELRVLSGSALDGRIALGAGTGEAQAFLGRHHLQVCALAEGRERELFGWIAPQPHKYSIWNVVAGRFAALRRAAPDPGLPLTTTTNGGDRAMVPIGSYERVMPMDIMATHLLRALVTGDAEQAVALGALELEEEDLALATFVCPGKTEYGPLLRQLLDRVEKEGV
jgi:Na+-transporting NADH:ubiquinone oxidoreductase subunit A